MGLDFNTTFKTVLGAFLHDIGLVEVYDKHPKLNNEFYSFTKEDYRIYSKHSEMGYTLVCDDDGIPNLSKKIILSHHIWDNYEKSYNEIRSMYTSYPNKFNNYSLTNIGTDLNTKIVSVSSEFDNLITKKEFRGSIDKSVMVSIIKEQTLHRFKEAGYLLLKLIDTADIADSIERNYKTTSFLKPVLVLFGTLVVYVTKSK
jgi:lipocalin